MQWLDFQEFPQNNENVLCLYHQTFKKTFRIGSYIATCVAKQFKQFDLCCKQFKQCTELSPPLDREVRTFWQHW